MAIKKIELAWITVSDLGESAKFFGTVLGLTVKQNSPEFGWVELQGKDGGCLLGLAQEEDEEGCSSCCCSDDEDEECCEMKTGTVLTFTVDDLDKTIAEFKAKGVVFIDEILEVPNGPRMISFIDLDGNMFQLVEETKMN